MLSFLIKKEITQNEDITLWSQKKIVLNFCFAHEKNLNADQIDKNSKNKRKSVFTILFFVSDHVEAANSESYRVIRKHYSVKHYSENYRVE